MFRGQLGTCLLKGNVYVAVEPVGLARSDPAIAELLRLGTLSARDLDHDGGVVAGALALALLAVDAGAADPGGQGRGAQHEVDPHPLAAGEAQLGVVPVRFRRADGPGNSPALPR